MWLAIIGAIRSFTTEATEATEAGRKGFRIRVQTLLSFRSVSVTSVISVVKSGADSCAVNLVQLEHVGLERLIAQHHAEGDDHVVPRLGQLIAQKLALGLFDHAGDPLDPFAVATGARPRVDRAD